MIYWLYKHIKNIIANKIKIAKKKFFLMISKMQILQKKNGK